MSRFLSAILVGALALMGVGTFVGLAVQRIPYPLEIDCIEGVMMDHITRLANDQPIFVEPTLQFIPLAYMPGFAAVSSLVTRFSAEPAFWQPRMVSFVASLLLMLLIAFIVRRETGRSLFALGAAGLFALGFGFTGASYDVARPDALMLLLAFSGLAALRLERRRRGAVAAGVLLTLAFFTKQHAALFILGAIGHLAMQDRRRLPAFALTALLGCGGGYALLSAWLGSWFGVFTWSIPKGWSQFELGRIQQYLGDGLFGAIGPLSVAVLLTLGSKHRPWSGAPGLWSWTAFAAVGTGLMATLDANAYRHLFTPTLVAFTIAGPIALHSLIRDLSAGGEGRQSLAELAATLVLAASFIPLLYPTHIQLPHARALEAHHELVARLEVMKGDVLMPYHGWYAQHSGHATSLQIIALDDIERSKGNEILRRDPEFLRRMFQPLRSGPGRPMILTDRPLEESGDLWASIAPGYRLVDSLGWMRVALTPITGNQFGPNLIYAPSEAVSDPDSTAMKLPPGASSR